MFWVLAGPENRQECSDENSKNGFYLTNTKVFQKFSMKASNGQENAPRTGAKYDQNIPDPPKHSEGV